MSEHTIYNTIWYAAWYNTA